MKQNNVTARNVVKPHLTCGTLQIQGCGTFAVYVGLPNLRPLKSGTGSLSTILTPSTSLTKR